MNWVRARAAKNLGLAIPKEQERVGAAIDASNRIENAQDREWLGTLLLRDGLKRCPNHEALEAIILHSIEWLTEHLDRPLHVTYRMKFASYERLFNGVEGGLIVPTEGPVTQAQKYAQKRRMSASELARQAAKGRREQLAASLPAWLSDPTLLPKRPPGR